MLLRSPRRTAATLGVVLLVPGLLAACGGGSSAAAPTTTAAPGASGAPTTTAAPTAAPEITEPLTIRFENYNLAAAGLGRDATLEMLAAFEAANPLIKVETKATTSAEMFPSVQAQVVAGDPPDVAQLLLREWDQNVENLPVVPLEAAIGADELQADLDAGYPFHPRAVALTQRNGLTYGLPYVFSTPTLFYNADLFRQAGLDPANPPKSWEEVHAAALAIGARTDAGGVYIACIETTDWCTQGIIRSNGGRVMSEDRSQLEWNDPATIGAFDLWQQMFADGSHVKLKAGEAADAFSAGNMGMFVTTSAYQSAFLKGSTGKWDLQATGMPGFGDRTPVPVNSGSGLAIMATDPVHQRAAWELVKFLTSEEAFQTITTKIGYLPLRTGMVDDPKWLAGWEHLDLMKSNIEQLDELEPSLSYPGQNAQQILGLFLDSVYRILYDGADPQTELTAAQQRAEGLMPTVGG